MAEPAIGLTAERGAGWAVAIAAAFVLVVGWAGAGAGYRNGDAAVYAAQAWSGDVGARPIHAAYVAVAWALGQGFGAHLPLALDLVSALAGAVTVGAASTLVRGPARAVVAALVAIAVLPEVSHAEVDLPWVALLVVAAAAPSPTAAALSAGLAVAVSPTALAGLGWVVVERSRREGPGGAALVAVAGAITVAALLAASPEWWSGHRGVSQFVPDPWLTAGAWGRRWDLLLAAGVLAGVGLRYPASRARWSAVLATAPLVLAPNDVPAWLLPAVALSVAGGDAWGARAGGPWARVGLAVLLLASLSAALTDWSRTAAKVAAESAVAAHVAAGLGPRDGLIAPWSWGARVSVIATGDPYGLAWRSTGEVLGEQRSRWCGAALERVAVLPAGAVLEGAGEGAADAEGVFWYAAPAGITACER